MLKARIYTEKKDLDDFLRNPSTAELNQSIYNALLSFRPAKCFKASALKIFNEAYYQATRVFSDQHPEDNFIDGYFNNARDDLGSCHDAKLTFSIVFLLLSSTTHRNIKSASFQDAITHNLQNGNPYFDTFRKIAERYEANHIYFDNDFCPTPVDVSQPVKVNWQAITHNFNATCIAEAVTLGDSEDRQHSILDAIELQFDSWKATQPDSLPDINFLPLHSYIVQSFNPNALLHRKFLLFYFRPSIYTIPHPLFHINTNFTYHSIYSFLIPFLYIHSVYLFHPTLFSTFANTTLVSNMP